MTDDVNRRSTASELLHPEVRGRVQTLLARLGDENIPFRLFEGFRAPQRQDHLYQQGRSRPGAIVTKAPPWRSYHQYGVAADLVLFENGRWSWNTKGRRAGWWSRMHELARAEGLEPLSWELPHVQLASTSIQHLAVGRYPGGGDASWAENLESAIISWTKTPPPPVPEEAAPRPPLGAEPGRRRLQPMTRAGWHARNGGRAWRYDATGLYTRDQHGGGKPYRTSGEPLTCRTLWGLYGEAIQAAAEEHAVPPELIMMTIATETAFARRNGFTGPSTFRWEPGVEVKDIDPPSQGDYSAGPMQVLASTARWVIGRQGLPFQPFEVAPAYRQRVAPPEDHPLYGGQASIELGTAVIAERWSKTGDDPMLVAAAYNAGGLYKSAANPWRLRVYGDHLDRAAAWYGDACAVLKEMGLR